MAGGQLMVKATLVLAGASALALLFTAAVPASAAERRETRAVSAFSEVEVGSALRAEISVGPEHKVEVIGDEALVPKVTTELRGDRLVVRMKEASWLRARELPLLRISAPKLRDVGASGASRVSATGLAAPQLTLGASGASELTVSGIASDAVKLDASGASRV